VKPVTLIVALILGCFQAYAQPRAVGALFSHTLTGVQFDIASSERTFHSLTLGANMYGRRPSMVKNQSYFISYDCNFSIISSERPSGIFTLYCGPEVLCALLREKNASVGFSAGLGVSLSVEYEFFRHIAIGLRASPSAGFAIRRTSEYASMSFYSSSIVEGAVPQITIKYCFF